MKASSTGTDSNRPKVSRTIAKWFFRIVISLLGALIIEVILTAITGLGSGPYGTPLVVGEAGGMHIVALAGGESTFDSSIFVDNVLMTASVFLAVISWSGIVGGIFMTIGGIASIALAIGMALLPEGSLPFVGLPIPLIFEESNHANQVVLWLDSLIIGFLFAAAWRRIHNKKPHNA